MTGSYPPHPLPVHAAIATIALYCLAAMPGCSPASPDEQEQEHVYSTWDTLNPDKCASMWLIKRYVDTKAEFRFYPKNSMDMEGIHFDTPTSKYHSTHDKSCFELVMAKHHLQSPELDKLAALIHAIEIGYWHAGDDDEASKLNDYIMGIIRHIEPIEQALEDTFIVFDHYAE